MILLHLGSFKDGLYNSEKDNYQKLNFCNMTEDTKPTDKRVHIFATPSSIVDVNKVKI